MSASKTGTRENPYQCGVGFCYNHPDVKGTWLLTSVCGETDGSVYLNCDDCKKNHADKSPKSWKAESVVKPTPGHNWVIVRDREVRSEFQRYDCVECSKTMGGSIGFAYPNGDPYSIRHLACAENSGLIPKATPVVTKPGTRENPWSRNGGCSNNSRHPATKLVSQVEGLRYHYLFCDICAKVYETYSDWKIEPLAQAPPEPKKAKSSMIGIVFDATVVVTENQISTTNGVAFPVKSEIVYVEKQVHAQDLTTGKALVLANAISKGKIKINNADLTQTIEVKVVQYS